MATGIQKYPDCREVIHPLGEKACDYRTASGQCTYTGACYAMCPKNQATKDAERVISRFDTRIG